MDKKGSQQEQRFTERVFYEQFAKNQNHHQTLFTQIGSSIIASVGGYAYVFLRTLDSQNPLPAFWPLLLALSVSLVLLDIGTTITTAMAIGFRRDQLVSCKIRAIDGTLEGFGQAVFPKSFNPTKLKSSSVLEWMPNYNIIFWVALFLIQLLLCGSMYWYIFDQQMGTPHLCILTGLTLVNIAINIVNLSCAHAKLKTFIKSNQNWFCDYKH